MSDVDDLKQSADRLADTAKESGEKLAAAARETAEIGVRIMREQIHGIVKDPATVERMKQMEETFDRQVSQATQQIEDGAKQLMNFWGGLLNQAKEAKDNVPRVEVEVEPSDKP
jgi:hypothetical protein